MQQLGSGPCSSDSLADLMNILRSRSLRCRFSRKRDLDERIISIMCSKLEALWHWRMPTFMSSVLASCGSLIGRGLKILIISRLQAKLRHVNVITLNFC